MSETPKPMTRSLGTPFWVGYAVTPVVLFGFLAFIHVLDSGWMLLAFLCVILGVFAPVGGLFFQAIRDLFAAGKSRQLRFWNITLLLIIIAAFVIAGWISLHMPGKYGGADTTAVIITAIVAGLLICIYSKRRST